MSRVSKMIREFHALLPGDTPQMRGKLTAEENEELLEALKLGDRLQIARELADVVYVAYGTAHVYNIDLDVALERVHASNMTKFDGATFRSDGKILKGPNFQLPDVSGALL